MLKESRSACRDWEGRERFLEEGDVEGEVMSQSLAGGGKDDPDRGKSHHLQKQRFQELKWCHIALIIKSKLLTKACEAVCPSSDPFLCLQCHRLRLFLPFLSGHTDPVSVP